MIDNHNTPGYLVVCACGHELRAGHGQAGTTAVCPACGEALMLPSLSQLRGMPIIAALAEHPAPHQVSVLMLAGLVVFVSLFTLVGKLIGFDWPFLMVPVCAAASIILGAFIPRPVVYGGVLAGILLVVGTLVTCSLVAAREDARRTSCTNNLKQLGVGYQVARQYRPDSQPDVHNWDNDVIYRPASPARFRSP